MHLSVPYVDSIENLYLSGFQPGLPQYTPGAPPEGIQILRLTVYFTGLILNLENLDNLENLGNRPFLPKVTKI